MNKLEDCRSNNPLVMRLLCIVYLSMLLADIVHILMSAYAVGEAEGLRCSRAESRAFNNFQLITTSHAHFLDQDDILTPGLSKKRPIVLISKYLIIVISVTWIH